MKCSGVVNSRNWAFGELRSALDRGVEDVLELGERDFRQRRAAVDHPAGKLARHVVRLAERDCLGAHERVGKLRQRDAGFVDMAAHFGAVDRRRVDQAAQKRHEALRGVERIVAGDLHFAFGVVHVGERRVVNGGEHGLAARGAERGDESQVLDRHRIALLRHDRAHLDEGVRHVQVADLEARPGVQVLHEAPCVKEHELQRTVDAGRIVGRRDRAVGVFLRIGKAQEVGHSLAIETEPGGRDRRRAHARKVDVARRVEQAVDVAQRQLDERGEVVTVGRRLRRLAVRVGDDNRRAFPLRDGEQSLDQREVRVEERRQPSFKRKLEHRVVDVVAATPGVQLAGDLDAQPTDELALDVEEEVLVLARVGEVLEIETADNVVERVENVARFVLFEQPALGEQHRARLVDAHLVAPVVALHSLEQRREHRVLVDSRREFVGSGHRRGVQVSRDERGERAAINRASRARESRKESPSGLRRSRRCPCRCRRPHGSRARAYRACRTAASCATARGS
jgi:hypothetical protein